MSDDYQPDWRPDYHQPPSDFLDGLRVLHEQGPLDEQPWWHDMHIRCRVDYDGTLVVYDRGTDLYTHLNAAQLMRELIDRGVRP